MAKSTETQQASDNMSNKSDGISAANTAGMKEQRSDDPLDLSVTKSSERGKQNVVGGAFNSRQYLGKLGKVFRATKPNVKLQQPRHASVEALQTNSPHLPQVALILSTGDDGNPALVASEGETKEQTHPAKSDQGSVNYLKRTSVSGSSPAESTPTIFDPRFSVARTGPAMPQQLNVHTVIPPPVKIVSEFKTPSIPPPHGLKGSLPNVSVIAPHQTLPSIASFGRRTQIFKPHTMQSIVNKPKSSKEVSAVATVLPVQSTEPSNIESSSPAKSLTPTMPKGGEYSATSSSLPPEYSHAYDILSSSSAADSHADDPWERASGQSYYEMIGVRDADDMDVDELSARGYLDTYPSSESTDSHGSLSAESEAEEEELPPMIPLVVETAEESKSATRYLPSTGSSSFWIYKLQPKGPKAKPMKTNLPSTDDPHQPLPFIDPVFNGSTQHSYSHFGRPRLGDGNDLTPNVEVLAGLGTKLADLNSALSKLSLDLSEDKKKKMRLSSEQCRLRRRANHEANKIIYAGLEDERYALSTMIAEMKRTIVKASPKLNLTKEIEEIKEEYLGSMTLVAGRTGDYVNQMLEEYQEAEEREKILVIDESESSVETELKQDTLEHETSSEIQGSPAKD